MGTPWTLTRLVRWRVKDLASCFLACRIPLEEDEQDSGSGCRQFPGQLPLTNIVFEAKDEGRSRRMGRKRSRKVGKKRHRRRDQNVLAAGQLESGDSSSSWTLFKDENYIVFCFKEDGAKFDDGEVVRDDKLEGSNNQSITSPPGPGAPTKTPHSPNQKEEEDGQSLQVELEMYSSDADKRSRKSVTSNETSDCSQSDTSTASFSFPVLGQEWSESPAQMPKPAEDLLLRADKIWPSGFQCCRF